MTSIVYETGNRNGVAIIRMMKVIQETDQEIQVEDVYRIIKEWIRKDQILFMGDGEKADEFYFWYVLQIREEREQKRIARMMKKIKWKS